MLHWEVQPICRQLCFGLGGEHIHRLHSPIHAESPVLKRINVSCFGNELEHELGHIDHTQCCHR
jgi:hypothetical protein